MHKQAEIERWIPFLNSMNEQQKKKSRGRRENICARRKKEKNHWMDALSQ